ncbi:hypothetical protein FLONG3_850 [Fusarium longipes]|uniref:Uncharacterized protein n=1 Tax=Fusarium longipes TaxID=694270 RepID=A0A395T8S6_9HYPO|nr:hypothetical protein FLONG3_850 [Fusarium longipes]
MVLRAIPTGMDAEADERCVTVARNTLDLHEQCMRLVDGCKDPLLIKRYISWAILHTPFFPFSIVFDHAVRHSDTDDLGRLERFAASFKSDVANREAATHPHRLYELLSQAARLCVQLDSESPYSSMTVPSLGDSAMTESEVADTLNYTTVDDMVFTSGQERAFNIGDWFHGNQQFLRLLHEDIAY